MSDPDFKKIIAVDELDLNIPKRVEFEGRELALINLNGSYHAIDDLCTHSDASLSDGCIEGDEIECPLHFARFKITTGEVTEPPAFEDLKTYQVKVEDGYLWVKI